MPIPKVVVTGSYWLKYWTNDRADLLWNERPVISGSGHLWCHDAIGMTYTPLWNRPYPVISSKRSRLIVETVHADS